MTNDKIPKHERIKNVEAGMIDHLADVAIRHWVPRHS